MAKGLCFTAPHPAPKTPLLVPFWLNFGENFADFTIFGDRGFVCSKITQIEPNLNLTLKVQDADPALSLRLQINDIITTRSGYRYLQQASLSCRC